MSGEAPAPLPLEASLGYVFRDRAWLRTALTPPSSGLSPTNQRLEFLGDAILQLSVSTLLFQEKPDWDEGALSKLRVMLVCTQSLCEWAQDLGVVLGSGPRSAKKAPAPGGRKPLADAMEALLAAIFLDAGAAGEDPLAVVSTLVAGRFRARIQEAQLGAWEERDSKTTLQERTALLSLPAPAYELVGRGGPDHAPVFTVRVRVGALEAQATAETLKRAQTEAARELLRNPALAKR